MPFSFYRQLNVMDCGPTCLRMIAKHYGKQYNADTLRQLSGFGKQGVSLLGISDTAEKIGFRTRALQLNFEKLISVPLPAILHWNQKHFVVLIAVNKRVIKIADPARGIISYDKEEFIQLWVSNRNEATGQIGTILLLEPTPAFYENENEDEKERKLSWSTVTNYLRQSKHRLFQVVISLFITSLLQLILPFLMQSMVDTGINTRDIQYITVVLIAQLVLTFSTTVVSFIRNRLQLKISNTVNISILSDFWIKLTRLPISYFDRHHAGDTLQRIEDNKKVQSFLTGQTITTFFSLFNFIVYSIILIFYNVSLFGIFIAGTLLYFGWIQSFMNIRRKINYATFNISAKESSATLQLVQGMQEIRLNNAEKLKRWEWENIQVNVFKLNLKSLNYNQWQSAGALFINQGKDILISFMVAQLVVKGQLTFGTMLAVQYIIGQLSGPISQFIGLYQGFQDAKISMERLNEIHAIKDEESLDNPLLSYFPDTKNIVFKKFSFSYPGPDNEPVLNDISLEIPEGKVTAIVGVSGSGKTTLLKLLLKIYDQYDGEIRIGQTSLKLISPSFWRGKCGAVLQDGFIFNDTVARNIAVGDEDIDYERLLQSCKIANILSFINTMPKGFNANLGLVGTGLSQGQKQRILIARAVYKQPEYLFFDEATNSLDANNEKVIVEQLEQFFKGRTVVIVAHRLSTVRGADKIVVLDKGKIVEEGTHTSLTEIKGYYYELVKNQLELGA